MTTETEKTKVSLVLLVGDQIAETSFQDTPDGKDYPAKLQEFFWNYWGDVRPEPALNTAELIQEGKSRFVVLYDNHNKENAIRYLGDLASDPKSDFTWYAAAVLSQTIKQGQNKK